MSPENRAPVRCQVPPKRPKVGVHRRCPPRIARLFGARYRRGARKWVYIADVPRESRACSVPGTAKALESGCTSPMSPENRAPVRCQVPPKRSKVGVHRRCPPRIARLFGARYRQSARKWVYIADVPRESRACSVPGTAEALESGCTSPMSPENRAPVRCQVPPKRSKVGVHRRCPPRIARLFGARYRRSARKWVYIADVPRESRACSVPGTAKALESGCTSPMSPENRAPVRCQVPPKRSKVGVHRRCPPRIARFLGAIGNPARTCAVADRPPGSCVLDARAPLVWRSRSVRPGQQLSDDNHTGELLFAGKLADPRHDHGRASHAELRHSPKWVLASAADMVLVKPHLLTNLVNSTTDPRHSVANPQAWHGSTSPSASVPAPADLDPPPPEGATAPRLSQHRCAELHHRPPPSRPSRPTRSRPPRAPAPSGRQTPAPEPPRP